MWDIAGDVEAASNITGVIGLGITDVVLDVVGERRGALRSDQNVIGDMTDGVTSVKSVIGDVGLTDCASTVSSQTDLIL